MAELDDVLDRAFGGARQSVGPEGGDAVDTDIGIGDDAAVVAMAGGRVVATTDFFTPIVDDARTWGHVAATNAIGDVHAMGGTPVAALVVLGWPAGTRHDDLDDVLAGLRAGAAADGVALVGGHTIDAAAPFVGLAVLGELDGPPMRQDAARPGDALVLTAPIGTGIATTAALRAPVADVAPGGQLHEVLAAAVAVMTTSNGAAADIARRHGVAAATDVTGFGLLGHLHRLARRSEVDVRVDANSVPVLPGVRDLARADVVPGGSRRNASFVTERAGVDTDPITLAVLSDAQTSGGLLLAVDPGAADALVTDLRAVAPTATRVGTVVGPGTGAIAISGTLDPPRTH